MTTKKPLLKGKQTASPVTSPKIPLPDALKEIVRRSQAIEAMRLKSVQVQEDCLLELAMILMETKDKVDASWEVMSHEFFGVCNANTLHRLVNRQTLLRGRTYQNICTALNNLRERNGLSRYSFPSWID